MPVTLTAHGLNIDGTFVPVYSGTVHYWRLNATNGKPYSTRSKTSAFT